jgi:hypothetical protein
MCCLRSSSLNNEDTRTLTLTHTHTHTHTHIHTGEQNGALYDIDSECEEGGDDDEKASKSSTADSYGNKVISVK